MELSGCAGYSGDGDASCMCTSYSLTNGTGTILSSSYPTYRITPIEYAYKLCAELPKDCSDADFNTFAGVIDDFCYASR